MVSSFADWLCNVMVWGAIIAFAVLLYEAFVARGFLAERRHIRSMLSLALAVVAVLVGALAEILGTLRRADARRGARPGYRSALTRSLRIASTSCGRGAGSCDLAHTEVELE